jgi:hypothetical protein
LTNSKELTNYNNRFSKANNSFSCLWKFLKLKELLKLKISLDRVNKQMFKEAEMRMLAEA